MTDCKRYLETETGGLRLGEYEKALRYADAKSKDLKERFGTEVTAEYYNALCVEAVHQLRLTQYCKTMHHAEAEKGERKPTPCQMSTSCVIDYSTWGPDCQY